MKLNKKGYMLVEIILASALAFGLAFFIIDLVIRLKNKNNDLLVETLITTDKTIITNKLMSYAKLETKNFDCNKLTITGNTAKYKDEIIDIITDYANVGELSCSTVGGKVSITIPISVPQMPDKDYDITFDYKYEIGDLTPPTCSITVSGTTITATFEDNDGGSGIKGEDTKTATINAAKDYIFTAEDNAGNSKSCSLSVINTDHDDGYDYVGAGTSYGWCTCQKNNSSDIIDATCGTSCSCPSGYYAKYTGNCGIKRTCSSGWTLTGTTCYKWRGINYYCSSSGYTKASNDYCYKINK